MNKKRKKEIILFTLVFGILLTAGCLENEKTVEVGDGTTELKTEDLASFCNLIATEKKYPCLAIVKKDPSICEEIPDEENVGWCYSSFARATGDDSVCDKAGSRGWQEQCYFDVAKINDDFTLDLCEKLRDRNLNSNCYEYVAIKTGDYTLCNWILNGVVKTRCLAMMMENITKCKELLPSLYDSMCCEAVLTEKGIPPGTSSSFCEKKMNFSRGCQDVCYVYMAKSTADPSLCEKFSGSYSRDFCYEVVAKNTKDYALCEKIKSYTRKKSCFLEIAELTKDYTICEQIEDTAEKDFCIAKAKKDPTFCKEIESTYDKGNCYYELAADLKNPSLCENIKTHPWKDNCLYKSVVGPDIF